MPDKDGSNDGENFDIFTADLAKGKQPLDCYAESRSDIEEALSRMTDPEVRAHFERLLKELSHRT